MANDCTLLAGVNGRATPVAAFTLRLLEFSSEIDMRYVLSAVAERTKTTVYSGEHAHMVDCLVACQKAIGSRHISWGVYDEWAQSDEGRAMDAPRAHKIGTAFHGWLNALGHIPGQPAPHPRAARHFHAKSPFNLDECLAAVRLYVDETGNRTCGGYKSWAHEKIKQDPSLRIPLDYNAITRRFDGSWEKVLNEIGEQSVFQQAGITHRRHPRSSDPPLSREQILDGVRDVYDVIGEPFTQRRYREHYYEELERATAAGRPCPVPSMVAIGRYIGTWGETLNEALPHLEIGTSYGPTRYSDEYLAKSYAACCAEIGHLPSGREYTVWSRQPGSNRPTQEVIRRRLGDGLWSAVPVRVHEIRGES
jgi:hypothetical protein